MSDRGDTWIKSYRKILDSRVFSNPNLLKVWIYCLHKANHRERWVTIKTGKGDTDVLVKPGQFIFGREKAAKELNMKPSSVRNRMQKLKTMRNLDIQADSHYSIISICNWELYQVGDNNNGQAIGQAPDRQRTTNGQAKDTNKKDKNEENDKKREIIPAGFIDLVVKTWNENCGTSAKIRDVDKGITDKISTRYRNKRLSQEWFVKMVEFVAKGCAKDDFLANTRHISLREVMRSDDELNKLIEKFKAKEETPEMKVAKKTDQELNKRRIFNQEIGEWN